MAETGLVASLRAWLRDRRRGLGLHAWIGLVVVGGIGSVVNGTTSVILWQQAADLRALAAGQDVAVEPDAAPPLLHARALHLLARDRIAEAEVFGIQLVRAGDPDLVAGYRFTLGNARLRRAFSFIEVARLNNAIPEVALAKTAYRAALAADPAHYGAKVNLDIAMRLVRDLPRESLEGVGDPDARPKKVWTDLPGLPRGGP